MYPKLKAVADRSAPAGTTSFSLSSALSPSLWFTRSLFPWSLPSLPCLRPTVTLSQAQLLSHTCVSKSAGQLLPWVWKGQPPCPLPNLTSSLSYDSLSLCHLFCSSLALCLQATTDGVFSDCSWRWLCRAAGVLSCSSPVFSLLFLPFLFNAQQPLK